MTGRRRNKKKPSMRRNKKTPSTDQLPQDIWPNILARMPVKTLLKFRCVCRSWRSLIDDPDFTSMHLTLFNNNREKPQILRLSWEGILRTHWLNPYKKSGTIFQFPKGFKEYVNGYANGLMLVTKFGYKSELMLLNPSLRKCLTLPPCPVGYKDNNTAVFLCIDPLTDDFKVVVLDCRVMPGCAAIFDLSKGTWRKKSLDCRKDVTLWTIGIGVSGKGAFHFIPSMQNSNLVVSFDLVSETLSYRDIPNDKFESCSLFIMRESLALFKYDREGFCIWVMGNSDDWTKQFSSTWSVKSESWYSEASFLFYDEKTDMLYISLFEELLSFHLKSDQLEVLHKFRDDVLFMDPYVESLVLANELEGQTLRFLSDLVTCRLMCLQGKR